MCKDCCARQGHGFSVCKCSVQVIQQNRTSNKENYEKQKDKDTVCKNCSGINDPACPNNLCSTCCLSQALRFDCPKHDISDYCKKMKDMYLVFSFFVT